MSTAIHTRYGAGKIYATADRGSERPHTIRVPYPHDLSNGAKHPFAARQLAEKMQWSGVWIVGHNGDGSIVAVRLYKDVLPSSIAGHTLAMHPLGLEGEDWFYIPEAGQ